MKLDSTFAAVVTGAASGLGEATARMLAAQGVKVALLDMNAERGAAVAGEIGGLFVACDVTSEASVEAALAAARAAHGRTHPGQLRRHRARPPRRLEEARHRRARRP